MTDTFTEYQKLLQLTENVMEIMEISNEQDLHLGSFEIVNSKEYIALDNYVKEFYRTQSLYPPLVNPFTDPPVEHWVSHPISSIPYDEKNTITTTNCKPGDNYVWVDLNG